MKHTQETDMIDIQIENDFELVPSDIVIASFDALSKVSRDHSFRAFTWDNDDLEPLLIDAFTASAMVQVHGALSEANQAKFRRMVEAGRGSFARLVDFTWKQIA